MKQHHFSHRFSLLVGFLSLLICVLTFAAPTALALSGKISEFAVPTANSSPDFITAGPDGNLWFTEFNTNKIGRITTAGVVTGEFATPTAGSGPEGITTGPDGNLWFTEENTNKIGRITTSGTITEFPLPTNCGSSFGCAPDGITAGPDGNLWFTEEFANQIGQLR
jgi:virginiamycin B lyase